MKIGIAQRLAAAVACLGMVVPQSAFAAAPAGVTIADVALRDGGVFVGKVVDAQGQAIGGTKVQLNQAGQEVVSTVTDQAGVFAAQGLRGGQYEVISQGGVASFRLWAPQTAPPSANTSALVVTGDAVVSGMGPGGGIIAFMQEHPLLVTAGIATAIAVPVALADDDDDAS